MPWSKDKPPKGTDKMKPHQLAACISAANSTLAKTKDEGEAMRACFGAAGKLGYKPQSSKAAGEEIVEMVKGISRIRIVYRGKP